MHDNWEEIIDELANLNPPKGDFTPRAVKKILGYLGNPQRAYKVIHITGTNGKGSTAAFIEAGLLAGGYSVAKFTSPYIKRLNECICVAGKQITDNELVELYLELREVSVHHDVQLSSFEMLTVILFCHAAKMKVDYLVLEAGMGGLNDATNVVESEFSIITNIALEHTQWLGNSLAEIAYQKAGIINGGYTIFADDTPELQKAVCKKTENWVNVLQKYKFQSYLSLQENKTVVSFAVYGKEYQQVNLSLLGNFQVKNFLVAYEVLSRIGLDDKKIFSAISAVSWPGRLQIIHKYPFIIVDASHNVAGVESMLDSVRGYFLPAHCVIILSILKDKNVESMLKLYSQLATTVIACNLTNQSRAITARRLSELSCGKFQNVHLCNSPEFALKYAKQMKPQAIFVSGSTYLLKYILPDKQE